MQVLDANDNDPMFGVTSVQVSLPESSAVGVRLPEVFLATDIDIGENANISYSITPASFTVNPITGKGLLISTTPLMCITHIFFPIRCNISARLCLSGQGDYTCYQPFPSSH